MAANKPKGMGFKAAAQSVSKSQGLPLLDANKIIAAGAQKASKKAQEKNPNLLKVSGVKKKP